MELHMKKIYFTGIKPTGSLHIGNYLGAIRPSVENSHRSDVESIYFIADYHAINALHDPALMRQYTYEVAAGWLALGLNPELVTFYRQRDIPELFELQWILTCCTAKGLLNRAHAYKAQRDLNLEKGHDPDHGINAGLYAYPVLMAADILLCQSHIVPVGKDQFQHIEMARDIANTFNTRYNCSLFRLPEPMIQDGLVLPGLDGRKMSKSYGNTIPLFGTSKELKTLINRFVTDSSQPEDPKDPELAPIFHFYRAFASPEQTESLAYRLRQGGLGWGHVKAELFSLVDETLATPRVRYAELMANPRHLDDILAKGAQKLRPRAQAFLAQVRTAIGM